VPGTDLLLYHFKQIRNALVSACPQLLNRCGSSVRAADHLAEKTEARKWPSVKIGRESVHFMLIVDEFVSMMTGIPIARPKTRGVVLPVTYDRHSRIAR